MKNVRLLILMSLLSFLFGCQSKPIDALLPEGKAGKARIIVTGKFSGTSVETENFVKTPQKVTADKIVFKHSNAWVPLVEMTLEDYERTRAIDEKNEAPTPSPTRAKDAPEPAVPPPPAK